MLIGAALSALWACNASASVIAGWDVRGQTGGVANFGPSPLAPSAADVNVTTSGLVRGSGVSSAGTASGAARAWGGYAWTNTSEATAIASNTFVYVTITPNPGATVSFTNISQFNYRRSGTGPATGELQYQVDSGAFVDVASLPYTSTSSSGSSLTPIDLSAYPDLQSVGPGTNVTFRIVNWGGGSAGTWYIFDTAASTANDFEISGTVVAAGAPPHITGIAPASTNLAAGQTAAFTVTATGGAATNLWFKETGASTSLIVNATNNTLQLANLTKADEGSYFVVLTNAYGSDTSAVVSLTVNDPFIAVEPVSVTGLLDGKATFSVGAAGSGLTYQWYYVDSASAYTPVQNGDQTSGSTISGANSSELMISGVQPADVTNFAVIVTGTFGSVTSSIASLQSVSATAVLAYWDFNGVEFTNMTNPTGLTNPVPFSGAGVAAPVGTTFSPGASPFAQNLPANVDPINGPGTTDHLPNLSWGTDNYPIATVGNKQNGVQFNVSTAGAKNIMISYDSRATSTASAYERLQYTTNGTDWIDYPTSSTFLGLQASSYYPFSYNLTGFPGVADNPDFAFRIVTEFQKTATYGIGASNAYVGTANTYGTSGTVSYDVVTVTGDAITNANQPPEVSALPDVVTNDYSTFTLNFTVSDDTTPPDELSYSAKSLTPNVDGNFVFGGSGANRTLTVTPNYINDPIAAGPILVTVTDTNGDSTSVSFVLTLTSVNTPPTNTLTTVTSTNMLANSSLTIPFTVGDVESSASGLTYSVSSQNNSVLPSENVVVNGQGTASPSLTITPAANQVGVVTITVTVTDSGVNTNGNSGVEPRTTTATFPVVVRPNTNVIGIDYFNYDQSGPLDVISGGYWQHLTGILHQLQAGSGVAMVDTLDNTENVQAGLLGAPYLTNSGAVLYASMIINMPDVSRMPINNGAYFFTFNDGSGVTGPYEGRILTVTNDAAPGFYRVGITKTGADASSTGTEIFPQDLAPGTNYTIVTSLVVSNGLSTIWVSPASENSPSVTDVYPGATNYNISDFELRESGGSGGLVDVSKLKIGTTFDSVLPALQISALAGGVVITWSDPTLTVQSAPSVTGPWTDLIGANSPYTPSSGSATMFYRFKPAQ
jgi:hypothetical protein